MILFSDLHLCEDSADTVFNEVLPCLEAATVKYQDSELACLGDFWHVRYKVPVVLQNQVHSWLFGLRIRGITLRLLPGNHDQVNVAGENALQVFQGLKGVSIYTEAAWDKDGFWIPYRQDLKVIENILQNSKCEPGSPMVLFIHHGIRGAMMNGNKLDTEGLSVGLLSQFQKIFCGHYHRRQYFGKNLLYVGSPYQTKADETGQEKGFTVWKRDSNFLENVTARWGKRYHNIVVSAYKQGDIPLDLSAVDIKRDEVRVLTKVGVNAEKVGKALINMGVLSHIVTPEVESSENRLLVGANATLTQFARAYVGEKAVGAEGEADNLWRVFEEIAGKLVGVSS